MSDQEARIGFQVSAGGVVYHITDLKLMPHETRAIDLRKLRDAQKPDFLGNKIPANATDGSALWGRIDNVPVMGRLVVLQRRKALASSYSCDPCSCPMSLTSYPLQLTPVPGQCHSSAGAAGTRLCPVRPMRNQLLLVRRNDRWDDELVLR